MILNLYKKWGGIIISPKCQNECLFCRPNHILNLEDLHIQEQNAAKNLIHLRKKGINKLEISGGDPVEYDKIADLVKYAHKIGFNEIMLSTHGRDLKNERFVQNLVKAGITKFRVPTVWL